MFEGYEVEGVIGRGGMGTVYRARVRGTGRLVALKALHEELADDETHRARFEREVHAMCRVSDSRIVRVLDVVTGAKRPYFVMELLAGSDLAARLGKGKLPMREVLNVALELAYAIRSLHALNIVHRDLKPSNVFLLEASNSNIRLLDLGTAKMENEFAPDLTCPSETIGTMSYMAPEQLVQTERVGPASDVWAYGLILFQMLTNTHPFAYPDTPLPLSIVHSPPLPLTDESLSPDLVSLVYRALAKDPRSRVTIGEIVATMERELRDFTRRSSAALIADTTSTAAHLHSYVRELADSDATLIDSFDEFAPTMLELPKARKSF